MAVGETAGRLASAREGQQWLGSLLYRSEATRPPDEAALDALLLQARARNRALGVTGMLLFDGRQFLQLLEGPPDAVEAVWKSIRQDPRHHDIRILGQTVLPARLCAGWDMQFFAHAAGPFHDRLARGFGRAELGAEAAQAACLARDGAPERIAASLADLVARGHARAALVAHVLEPAARLLGDAWLRDEIGEFDLALALGMLQQAAHALYHAAVPLRRPAQAHHRVLLATAPGETHLTGLCFLARLFDEAGWETDVAFPVRNSELVAGLLAARPDAVDIALSDALPRAEALQSLRETVRCCREAWPDDSLVISVGGRLFAERRASAEDCGADHGRTSVLETPEVLARLVERHRLTCACGSLPRPLRH